MRALYSYFFISALFGSLACASPQENVVFCEQVERVMPRAISIAENAYSIIHKKQTMCAEVPPTEWKVFFSSNSFYSFLSLYKMELDKIQNKKCSQQFYTSVVTTATSDGASSPNELLNLSATLLNDTDKFDACSLDLKQAIKTLTQTAIYTKGTKQ